MKDNDQKIQSAQEKEYWFPYHHASRFYPHFSTGYSDRWAMNYNLSLEMILELISMENPVDLIDIGCGDGRLLSEITKQYPSLKIKGVDYSKRAIQLAKAMEPAVEFEELDITSIPNTSNITYSMAILMEVLEHIPTSEADRFSQSVATLIAPEGLLIVTVPHKNKPLEYKHFQHFTMASLNSYFEDNFNLERVIYIEKRGWLNFFLNKVVVNAFFVLNHHRLLDTIYRLYKKHVFYCDNEKYCARIAICYRKKSGQTI